MRTYGNRAFVLACSTAAAAVIVGAASLIISRPAAATAQFCRPSPPDTAVLEGLRSGGQRGEGASLLA